MGGEEAESQEDLGLGVSELGGSPSFSDIHSFRFSPLTTWK